MGCYETMVIFPATLSPEELEKTKEQILDYYKRHGIEGVEVKEFGRRTLAYPIKKHNIADYYLFRFKTDNPEINAVEERMRYNENILRYMTVKIPEKFFAPMESEGE